MRPPGRLSASVLDAWRQQHGPEAQRTRNVRAAANTSPEPFSNIALSLAYNLLMVPVAVVRLLMVLLKPPRSSVAPVPTLNALLALNAVVLPALRVPSLIVVLAA